ncbi:hypothetical protein FQZ97_945950 [compost metagenome]
MLEGQAKGNRHFASPLDRRTDQGDGNRIAHLFDLFGQGQSPAARFEKIVLVDDRLQMLAGHHALADDLDALVSKGIVVPRHQVRRYLLRLDQDSPGRLIDRWHGRRHQYSRPDYHDHRHNQQHRVVLDDCNVVVDRHFVFSSHRSSQS